MDVRTCLGDRRCGGGSFSGGSVGGWEAGILLYCRMHTFHLLT